MQALSQGGPHGRGCFLWRCAALVALAAAAGRAQSPDAAAEDTAQLRRLSLAQLMDIEVTSVSRTESTMAESPAAIFVITQDMIRRSGATAIPELFRLVPGMDVARMDGNKWAIGVRGFNNRYNNKLLVLMDGRTLYNPLTSGVFWDALDYPLEDIERIEVIRGPGASVWGANAVNGVINIITKSAKDTQGGLRSGGGGTEQRAFGTVRYSGKVDDGLYYRVYGKGFDQDEQFSPDRQASPDGDPNDSWRGTSTGLRLDWQATPQDTVTLDAGYTRADAGRKDRFPVRDGPPYAKYFPETETSDAGHVLVDWSHQTDTDSGLKLQAFWDGYRRQGDNGFADVGWNTYDVDFQHQFPLGGRQEIVWGLGYRLQQADLVNSRNDGGFYLTWLDNHPSSELFSSFLQDQIALVKDRLSLTLGAKVEHNDYTGFEVQPTARLLWTPTKQQSAWAAASRAVRTRTWTENDAQFTSPPANPDVPPSARTVANRDMDAEKVWAYEVGYRVQATKDLSLDAALFYNDYADLRVNRVNPSLASTLPPPLTVASQFDNGMDGETYGVELAANWRLTDGWRLYGTYTFLQMRLHADEDLPAASRKSFEAAEGQSPEQQAYLQSSWDLSRNVEFDLIGRYVDRLSGFNPSGLPGVSDTVHDYIALDARLAWRARKNLELSLVGQNLTDDSHAEFGTNPFVRSPLVELQRAVYGKVTYWF